jgi:hypothetical protein
LDKFCTYFEKIKIKIVGIVSDRATALVKLGSASCLNVCSMPDLFPRVLGLASRSKEYKSKIIANIALQLKIKNIVA